MVNKGVFSGFFENKMNFPGILFLSQYSAKVLNLDVAGVDIIRSNRGPLLLEVNSSPGLEGIENTTGLDIANVLIETIERKLKYSNRAQEL